MSKEQTQAEIKQLKKSVKDLAERVTTLERQQTTMYPTWAPPVQPGAGPSTKCPRCGMVWTAVMSYSCPYADCPMQPQATCGAPRP